MTKNNTSSKQINDSNNKIIEQTQNSNKDINTINNNTNSNPNSNTKKSLSVNKVNTNINKPIKFENVTISNNFHNVKLVSLSQGKNNNKQSNNNILNNSPTQNITQNSFNIQKINIIGNNYNPNKKSKNNNYLYSNDFMAFTNTNIDGYKTFFNINKSKDKYNFKIK